MENRTRINEAIYGLNYKPEQILAFNGNTVGNVEPKSGEMDGNNYIVYTRTKQTMKNDSFDVAVPSANLDVTYPGATLLANSKLVDGKPQTLAGKRGAVTLTINLPGMTEDGTRVIPEASYANVLSATNSILNQWYDKCGGKYQIPANMSYNSSLVHDEKSLQLKFGCNVGFLQQKIGIDFNAIASKKKSVFLVEYKQVFYTASVTPFSEPADAFDPSVSVELLRNNGMNDDNPPAYVGSVVYGRQVFVKFESTAKAQDLSAMLNAAVSVRGVDISPAIEGKYKNVIENTRVSIVAMGGTPLDIKNAALSKDADSINNAILNNVELSPQNPAFPLTYKVVFLKDNKTADFCGTTEYVEENYETLSSGEVYLNHDGAYVAEFYVSWDEITGYDEKGNPITKRVNWNKNGDNLTAGFSTVIALSGKCRNINIKAQGKTGLVWEPWRTSIDKKGLALVPKRTVKIWGTTLNQKSSCDPNN